MRVLVVDDDSDSVLILTALLETDGHQVVATTDPATVVSEMRRFEPQVVLLDIRMPGANGYEIARGIRDQPGGQPIIIAVTGSRGDAARTYQPALLAGFNHYVTKPYRPESLLALVRDARPQAV